jgi:hypothetical protein
VNWQMFFSFPCLFVFFISLLFANVHFLFSFSPPCFELIKTGLVQIRPFALFPDKQGFATAIFLSRVYL